MKLALVALLVCALGSVASAADLPPPPGPGFVPGAPIKPARFDFQAVNVAQAISLVYQDAIRAPYVIAPALLQDQRLVSFRFDASKGDFRVFWAGFLDSLGYVLESRSGVDYVKGKPPQDKDKPIDLDVFVYHPENRPMAYLVELLSPLFQVGRFTVSRSVHPPIGEKPSSSSASAPASSAAGMIDQDSDTMIFQGTKQEIERLKQVLQQVDTPSGEVMVKAVLYEVSTGQSDGTAFALTLNLLGGKLGISYGGDAAARGNTITFKTGSIDLAISALAGDSRFHAVSTPQLRVKSGGRARLMVGQEVPTLGAVSYPNGGGQAVQSVEYRSSGVIFELTPQIRGKTVDLSVSQQISDFGRTETGVNDSPTLTKRELSTTVSAADDELIVLGGLTQNKTNDSDRGLSFLPRWMYSKSTNESQTEILLMLQVTKVGSVPRTES